MKNKKGFSLIELLAVVIILAILLIITIPNVIRYISKGKNSYYISIEKQLNTTGSTYMEDYHSLLPKQVGHLRIISIEELVSNKYIDEIKDENGNKCTGQVVVEKIKKDSYTYNTCLICGEDGKLYKSDQEICDKNEGMNKYADTEDYSIIVDEGPYEANLGYKYDTPMATVYYKNQPYTENGNVVRIHGIPNTITAYELKEYPVNYYYHGAKASIKVKVNDETPPSTVSVVLRRGDENGKMYKEGWSNVDLYAKYKAIDYSGKGISGTGIAYYEVSSNKDDPNSWSRLSSNDEYLREEGSFKRYIRAVDNNGKIGPVTEYVYKIDKTPPKCSLEVKSGTPYTNKWNVLWYNTDITVGYKTLDGTYSEVVEQPITYRIGTTITINPNLVSVTTPQQGLLVKALLKDEAGNTNTCDITVNMDNVKPKLTVGSTTSIQNIASNRARDYFSQWFSISKEESIVCYLMDPTGTTVLNQINNVNELKLGRNYVTCTSTSGSGLQATAKTQFKHWYYGKVHCSDGEVTNENRATGSGYCRVYHSNCDECGCDRWPSCQNSCCGVAYYQSTTRAECGSNYEHKCNTCSKSESFAGPPGNSTCNCISGCDRGCSCECTNGNCTRVCNYSCCHDEFTGYKTCPDPSKPVYSSCSNSCCGSCEQCSSCHYEDNSTRTYSCDITATASGTTGNGSLSGQRCSF